jgi:hypothetical protein
MINKDKIKIYKKYNGDIDAFARHNLHKKNDLIEDEDFFIIMDLLQNIEIVDKGLASLTFKDKLTSDLIDKVEPDCIDLLKQLKIKK